MRYAGGMETVSTPRYVELYKQAFDEYDVHALWSTRMLPDPTPADALVIARVLRIEGDLRARKLAEEIERVCRAAQ